MTMSARATSLVGAQLTSVTVRVHLTDSVGVQPRGGTVYDFQWPCPCVELLSFDSAGRHAPVSPQSLGDRIVSLHLESGTAQDGVWVGSAMLGAVDSGYWRPVAIHAGTLNDPDTGVDGIPRGVDFVPVPADITASTYVRIVGSDWPVISLRIPSVVTPAAQPFVISGYALTSRTRRPLAGLRIVVTAGACDRYRNGPGVATRTTSTGRWALSSTDHRRIWCAFWAQDRVRLAVNNVFASRRHVRETVSVYPAAASVRAGSSIAVVGCARPVGATGGVTLQRYSGGTWRTEGRNTSTHTCSYRLAATPPRGTWSYRVVVAPTEDVFGTVSRTFVLRGA